MNAWLLLCALTAAQVPAADNMPVRRSLLLMPIVLPPKATPEQEQTAAAVERSLARSMARHGAFDVQRMSDVRRKLGVIAQQQMAGCDAEGCLAQLGESMGADQILQGHLRQTPGLWTLRISLLERRTAKVTLRRELKARSVDALVASVEPLAREASGGVAVMATDPDLADRLGTTPQGAQQLLAALRSAPGKDPVTAWTDLVLASNRESERLALVEGALLLVAGILMVAPAPLISLASLVNSFVFSKTAPPWLGGPQENTTGPYLYPVTQMVVPALLGLPFVVGTMLVLAAAGVAVVDALDLGRLPVKRNGCCRDETRIRGAAKPGVGRKVAPYLAAAGGVLAMLWPIAVMVPSIIMGTVGGILVYYAGAPVPDVPGPSLSARDFALLYMVQLVLSASGVLLVLAVGAGGLAGALLLVATEHAPVVDGD